MKGLKYISWNEHSGYAVAARRYLSALSGANVPLTWTPMVPGKNWGKEFYYQPYEGHSVQHDTLDPLCNAPIEYDTVLIHLVPEYFLPWKAIEPGKRLIGYTTWETDRLPLHWPNILNQMDEIWVPSSWNQQTFVSSGVTVPVHVVPHILKDPSTQNSSRELTLTEGGVPAHHQMIYSINVWSERKALDQLLQVYWSTFTASDPVTLVIKTGEYHVAHPWKAARFPLNQFAKTKHIVKRLAKAYPNRPSTQVITEELVSQEMIDSLHARGDIYISLSHAEGWGLGAFDAVAAGNPVIIPAYSGPLDFLDPEAAGLVKYREIPASGRQDPNFKGPMHHWAAPDLSDAGHWMRKLVENPDDAASRGSRLQNYARQNFNESAVLNTMIRLLETPNY